jgi:hypothetical protein
MMGYCSEIYKNETIKIKKTRQNRRWKKNI